MNSAAIFDAHHHLWDRGRIRYAWLSEPTVHPLPGLGDLAPIQADYGPADFLTDLDGFDVVGSVLVEGAADPGWGEAELDWMEIASAGLPDCRIVAHLDLAADGAEAQAEALAARSRVAGVRQILNWDGTGSTWSFAPDDLLAHAGFRRAFARVAALGLTFDAQLWHGQFADLLRLCDASPGARVVVDHCGMPLGWPQGDLRSWRRNLALFRDRDDAWMKVSGLAMLRRTWTAAEAAPVLDAILEVFGPKRILFGSNLPVDRMGMSGAAVVRETLAWARGTGPEVVEGLFRVNGPTVYARAAVQPA